MASRGWRPGVALASVATLLAAGGSAAGVAATSGGRARPRGTLLSSTTGPADTPAPGATITVTGTGEASAPPDALTLQIGASTRRGTAVGALDGNDAEVGRLEAVLFAAGVGRADLQTSDLQLNADTTPSGVVTGYTATDEITVTMRDLGRAGAVIDAAARAVGNDVTIDGITFGRASTAGLLGRARMAAMADAATEAQQLATAAGVRLGGIVKVTDEEPQVPIAVGFAAASAPHAVPVPLQSGTTSVSAQVQVVYALTS